MSEKRTLFSGIKDKRKQATRKQCIVVNDKNHHFRDLKCWQLSRELRKQLFSIAKSLPDYEKYGLASQIRRAAVSITANIAEGYGRFHYKENIQFCRQSRASLYECEDHLITCLDENFIGQKKYDEILSLMIETRKVTDGYIRYLQKESKKNTDK